MTFGPKQTATLLLCCPEAFVQLSNGNDVGRHRGAVAALMQGSVIDFWPQSDNAGTDLSWEGSQSTSSEAHKILEAAWAATAGPARLAADWRSGANASTHSIQQQQVKICFVKMIAEYTHSSWQLCCNSCPQCAHNSCGTCLEASRWFQHHCPISGVLCAATKAPACAGIAREHQADLQCHAYRALALRPLLQGSAAL